LTGGAKSVSGSGQREVGKWVEVQRQEIPQWSAPKKRRGISNVFRNPLRPIPNLTTCPSRPGARDPMSVAISFDLLRKRRVMMLAM
jgi:hypothetical protein